MVLHGPILGTRDTEPHGRLLTTESGLSFEYTSKIARIQRTAACDLTQMQLANSPLLQPLWREALLTDLPPPIIANRPHSEDVFICERAQVATHLRPRG